MSREDRILHAGLAKLEFDPTLKLALTPLCRAIAAMVAEATKPSTKRKKAPDERVDYLRGRDIWEELRKAAPDAVAWEPCAKVTLSALGKAAHEAGADAFDLHSLAQFLRNGGLAWMRETPTTSYIARNLAELVARARATRKKGAAESALDRIRGT